MATSLTRRSAPSRPISSGRSASAGAPKSDAETPRPPLNVKWKDAGALAALAKVDPILRFEEVPQVDVMLIDRPAERFLGVGEGSQGPMSAAIANAVFNATGKRLRGLPFTPERVRAALKA